MFVIFVYLCHFEASMILRLALKDPYHPSNTPIYQTSTFVQPSSSEFGPYDYTRQSLKVRIFYHPDVSLVVFFVRLGESHAYSLGETCCNDGSSKRNGFRNFQLT